MGVGWRPRMRSSVGSTTSNSRARVALKSDASRLTIGSGIPMGNLGAPILLIRDDNPCHLPMEHLGGKPRDIRKGHRLGGGQRGRDAIKEAGVCQRSYGRSRQIGASRPGNGTVVPAGRAGPFPLSRQVDTEPIRHRTHCAAIRTELRTP